MNQDIYKSMVEMLTDDSADLVNLALDAIDKLSLRGDPIGIKALEEAMRIVSGNKSAKFYEPGISVIANEDLKVDYAGQLTRIASEGQFLKNPYLSGKLLTAFYHTNGDSEQLQSKILREGGDKQEKAFILLDNYLKSYARLKKAQGDDEVTNGTVTEKSREEEIIMEKGTCDLCNSDIPREKGYCFYSAFIPPSQTTETGNMLICDSCADLWFTDKHFDRPLAVRPIIKKDFSENFEKAIEWLQEGNTIGAITLCKKHGFSPQKAKEKGRELAELLWQNKKKGAQETTAFWTSIADKPETTVQDTGKKETCQVCHQDKSVSDGKMYTPSEIRAFDMVGDNGEDSGSALGIWSFATNMISPDQWEQLKDSPFWWICSSCKSIYFFKSNESGHSTSAQPSGDGCFIATACYGSEHCFQVAVLRRFRDDKLLTNCLGRAMVKSYYEWSPRTASFLSQHILLSKIVKTIILNPTVFVVNWSFEFTNKI